MVKRRTIGTADAPTQRYGSGVSRRARQAGYSASGLLILVGGVLGVVVPGAAGAVSSLALMGLGIVFASTMVYLDLAGGDQPARAGPEAERERLESEARQRIEAQRRAVERDQALERDRERQRERHDALSGPVSHHERPRRLRSPDRRRPS
jgi:hypothetical protein